MKRFMVALFLILVLVVLMIAMPVAAAIAATSAGGEFPVARKLDYPLKFPAYFLIGGNPVGSTNLDLARHLSFADNASLQSLRRARLKFL